MLNKVFMTAGTFILSMMVLVAATQVETLETNLEHGIDNTETLSGEVFDAETEEGIPNATVYLKNGDTSMNPENPEADSTTTDRSGEFTFEEVETDDTYTLEVEARGYENKEKEVDMSEDGEKERDRDREKDKDKNKIKISLESEY